MLNLVLQHLKGLTTGTQTPYLDNPIMARVMPPQLADVALQPFLWIWSGTSSETRQSAPRPMVRATGTLSDGGYQVFTWKIQMALDLVMTQDDPNIEQTFPLCHDAIVKVLNTCVIPKVVQTPATQQYSQILTIGENLTSNVASIRFTGPAGNTYVRFGATITCEVKEKVAWTEGLPA